MSPSPTETCRLSLSITEGETDYLYWVSSLHIALDILNGCLKSAYLPLVQLWRDRLRMAIRGRWRISKLIGHSKRRQDRIEAAVFTHLRNLVFERRDDRICVVALFRNAYP